MIAGAIGTMHIPGHLVDTLAWTLLHFCWQAAAGALLYGFVRRFPAGIRPLGASKRYALATGTLLVLAVSPVVTFLLLAGERGGAVLAPLPWLAEIPAPVGANGGADLAGAPAWAVWVVIFWICGVLAFSLRFAVGYRRWRRLERRAACLWDHASLRMIRELQQRLAMGTNLDVRLTPHLTSPAVVGFFRYTILLPVTFFSGLSTAQAEAILAHELAHIQRRDGIVNLLQAMAETLFFFHPAIWWLSREIRREREKTCDLLAAGSIGSRIVYAEALLALEELRVAECGLAMAARRNSLEDRVRHLMEAELPRAAGVVSVALAALPLVALLGGTVWAMTARAPLSPAGDLPSRTAAGQAWVHPSQEVAEAERQPASAAKEAEPERRELAQAAPAPQEPAVERPRQATPPSPAEAPDGETQNTAPAPGTLPVQVRIQMISPQSTAKPAPLVAKPDSQRAAALAALMAELEGSRFLQWVLEDVAYLIRDDELLAMQRLKTDAEREEFVRQFWLRRDPTPGTDRNEAKEEHYRRIHFANERFGDGPVSGWRSERGRVYIQFGPPDEIRDRPQDGYQRWSYRQIPGVGDNISFEFGKRPVGVF